MPTHQIVLADDNTTFAAMVREALGEVNHDCHLTHFCDGGQLIEYLFGVGRFAELLNRPSVSLVLLDLSMPDVNGLEVLEVLRQVRDHGGTVPPVVILTSCGQDEIIAKAYRLGAQSYLLKPATFTDLLDSMRQLSQYWLDTNTAPSGCRRLNAPLRGRLA